jgi:hypothetical protein
MSIDPKRNVSNQNSNSKREQITVAQYHPTKTNKSYGREYGLLDDNIILSEDFA